MNFGALWDDFLYWIEEVLDNFLKPILVAFVVFAIMCLIAILCIMPAYNKEIEKYNEGVCTECGQQFVLKEAVGHRNSTTHIFQCENCGKLIELEYYNPLND